MDETDEPVEAGEAPYPYIAGVYNYCDRWCEQCRFTDRCRVFATEREVMERHLLRGEDPEDMDVVMKDVASSFQESLQLLRKMADEMGVDVDAVLPSAPEPPRRMRDEPIEDRSRRWMDRVGAVLARVQSDIAEVSRSPQAQEAAGWLPRDDDEARRLIDGLSAVRDGADLLARFRFLVPVKISRAVYSLREAAQDDRHNQGATMRQDALRTARLIVDCLDRCETALWPIGELNPAWRQEALSLVLETQALRQEVEGRFPGWEAELRPGFDDPDATSI